MKKILLTVLLAFMFVGVAYSQVNVTGIVLDPNGDPLPGVSVVEKGTQNGVSTNFDGKYSIDVTDLRESKLEFSFMGFENKTTKVNGRSILDITLEESTTALDEVIVVGYGSMKKSDLTGSISSVKLEGVTTSSNTLDQALQGRVSGVSVATASGEPGAAMNIRIRGLTSLSVSNQPLYVIDGVPMELDSDSPDAMGGEQTAGISPLIGLNSNDVKSVEILKDASATAIYGSRGANGVVLITTKGGEKNGKSKIYLTSTITVAQASKQIDVLRPQQYAEFQNEYEYNSSAIKGKETNYKYDGKRAPLPKDVEGYFWQDEILRTSLSQDYNLGISGSTKKGNYYLSFGYSDLQGIVLNSSMKRSFFSAKYSSEITKNLSYKLSLSYSNSKGKGTSTAGKLNSANSAMNWMISKTPIVLEDDGSDPDFIEQPNPLTFVNDYISEPTSNQFRNKISFDYKLTKGISFEVLYGFNYNNNSKGEYWPRSLPMTQYGRAGLSTKEQNSNIVNALMHFNEKIDSDNTISGVIGAEYSQKKTQSMSIRGDNFPDDDLGYHNMSAASIYTPPVYYTDKSQLLSYIARFNYSFKNRYLLTFTGRADGSSKFPEDKRYSFFPSASIAWRVTQEDFMSNVDNIDNFKVRLSWGQAGNQGLPAYSSQYKYVPSFYPTGGTAGYGYSVEEFGNDLTWETSEQANFGVDLGLLKNRINLSVDIYSKLSKDILILRTVPLSTGYDRVWDNLGEISNKGIDVEAMFTVIDSDFHWNLGGNISYNKNKIESLKLAESSYGEVQFWGKVPGGFTQPVNTFIQGESIGLFWGYETEGLFQNQAEIDALQANIPSDVSQPYYQGKKVFPGDVKYKDINGDGIVNEMDMKIIGDPNPDFTYGITSNMTYKNFGFNLFFVGVQGSDVFNQNLQKVTNTGVKGSNLLEVAYNGAWRGEGTSNYYPRIGTAPDQNRLKPSDRFIEDGSYFRLQSASLTYLLKLKKSHLSDINFSITGNNLFTITNYSWFNPEANTSGNNNLSMGIDSNSYPLASSIVFSVRFAIK